MARLRVDKRVYDKADVTIALLGDIPAGVVEMSYSKETAHELVYGLDRKPKGYSMGKESYTSSITLLMPEVVRIEDSIEGDKDLVRIQPFWVFVTYTNEHYKIVVDKLLVKFKNQGRDVNDEAGLSRQFELFTLDVKFNVL